MPSAADAADITAITDLIHKLALYSDKATVEQWGALIADDVYVDLFGSVSSGREATLAGSRERRASGRTGPGSGSRHLVTTVSINVDGDRATGDVTVLFYTATDPEALLGRVVNYADTYTRNADGWKLLHRVAPSPT